jgi:hypothetical protein
MSIRNETENKRNLSGINLNVILKSDLTEPEIRDFDYNGSFYDTL